VSKLDIILEAIKYIDDLQDQLIDRLSGAKNDQDKTSTCVDADLPSTFVESDDLLNCCEFEDENDEEDLISLSDGYMSDPGLVRKTSIFIIII